MLRCSLRSSSMLVARADAMAATLLAHAQTEKAPRILSRRCREDQRRRWLKMALVRSAFSFAWSLHFFHPPLTSNLARATSNFLARVYTPVCTHSIEGQQRRPVLGCESSICWKFSPTHRAKLGYIGDHNKICRTWGLVRSRRFETEEFGIFQVPAI